MLNQRHIFIFFLLLFASGCTTTTPNRNPTGEQFPQAQGTSLTNEIKQLPDSFSNEYTILLIGYVQNAQFDIDRWLIGLDMIGSTIPVFEIPTINGMFPKMFKTQIDNGMRSGIPKPLWKGVITVYEDADEIVELTGNEKPNNARVIMLDPNSKVIYFNDKGFSVDGLKALMSSKPQE